MNEETWKAFVDECVSKGEWEKIAEQPRRPLLAKEVEDSLIEEAANGSKAALTRLIYLYFREIVKYAKRYESYAKDKDIKFSDLIATSKYGFARAVFGYTTKNIYATKKITLKFISYAIKWIREMLIEKTSELTEVCETNWYQKALEDHKIMNEEDKDYEKVKKKLEQFCKEHKIAMDEESFREEIMQILGPFYFVEKLREFKYYRELILNNLDELYKMKQEGKICI